MSYENPYKAEYVPLRRVGQKDEIYRVKLKQGGKMRYFCIKEKRIAVNPERDSSMFIIVEDAFSKGIRSSDGWFSWTGSYASYKNAERDIRKHVKSDKVIYNGEESIPNELPKKEE